MFSPSPHPSPTTPAHFISGSDLILWLLVGTPSAIRHDLASRRAEHKLPYSNVTIYIFLIYNIYHLCYTCIDFYDLSALGGCWFIVYIRRFIYKIFKCVSFWLHGCCGKWEGWACKPANRTSWVAVVTPTDRPKSVCNRCVIELFCGVVCVLTALLTFMLV